MNFCICSFPSWSQMVKTSNFTHPIWSDLQFYPSDLVIIGKKNTFHLNFILKNGTICVILSRFCLNLSYFVLFGPILLQVTGMAPKGGEGLWRGVTLCQCSFPNWS